MDMFKHFFECYFHVAEESGNMEIIIQRFKKLEPKEAQAAFISELALIKRDKLYKKASQLIKTYGERYISPEKTEKLVEFLYSKFIDIPTSVTIKDFKQR